MISKKIRELLNEQIKHELESAYLYLSMAAYFHSNGLDGMGQWMRVQSLEELTHAQKIFDHIVGRGGRIELLPLSMSKIEWPSALAAFENAYQHEQFITGKINDLVKTALEEKDYAANAMLQWFVTEQVEEEANTSKVAQLLNLIGSKGDALLMLDRELGTRTFVMPTAQKTTE